MIYQQGTPTKGKKMKLAFINGSGSDEPDVMVHLDGCRDVARTLKRQGPFSSGTWSLDLESKREAWLEYNDDFINEGSESWPLTFYPCTKGLPEGGEFNYSTYRED